MFKEAFDDTFRADILTESDSGKRVISWLGMGLVTPVYKPLESLTANSGFKVWMPTSDLAYLQLDQPGALKLAFEVPENPQTVDEFGVNSSMRKIHELDIKDYIKNKDLCHGNSKLMFEAVQSTSLLHERLEKLFPSSGVRSV